MLTAAQAAAYDTDGFVIVPDWLGLDAVGTMLRVAKADSDFTDAATDVKDQQGLSTRLAIRMW